MKLKSVLLEKNMTQRELSDKSNIPESYISLYLHRKFNLDTIQQEKICKVLQKKKEEVFD